MGFEPQTVPRRPRRAWGSAVLILLLPAGRGGFSLGVSSIFRLRLYSLDFPSLFLVLGLRITVLIRYRTSRVYIVCTGRHCSTRRVCLRARGCGPTRRDLPRAACLCVGLTGLPLGPPLTLTGRDLSIATSTGAASPRQSHGERPNVSGCRRLVRGRPTLERHKRCAMVRCPWRAQVVLLRREQGGLAALHHKV